MERLVSSDGDGNAGIEVLNLATLVLVAPFLLGTVGDHKKPGAGIIAQVLVRFCQLDVERNIFLDGRGQQAASVLDLALLRTFDHLGAQRLGFTRGLRHRDSLEDIVLFMRARSVSDNEVQLEELVIIIVALTREELTQVERSHVCHAYLAGILVQGFLDGAAREESVKTCVPCIFAALRGDIDRWVSKAHPLFASMVNEYVEVRHVAVSYRHLVDYGTEEKHAYGLKHQRVSANEAVRSALPRVILWIVCLGADVTGVSNVLGGGEILIEATVAES